MPWAFILSISSTFYTQNTNSSPRYDEDKHNPSRLHELLAIRTFRAEQRKLLFSRCFKCTNCTHRMFMEILRDASMVTCLAIGIMCPGNSKQFIWMNHFMLFISVITDAEQIILEILRLSALLAVINVFTPF